MHLKSINDVVAWRMCIGCGACAYICPEQKISLFDFVREGIRPVAANDACAGCTACLDVCPAVETDFQPTDRVTPEMDPQVLKEWGPVLEVWEGHATDPEVRYRSSSGGALTALSAFCLEQGRMHGVLHTGADPVDPIRNATRLSRSRGELMEAAGSRYSPASICNGLDLVEAAPASCVVIGKPSEVAAVYKAQQLRPQLAERIGLVMSFYCAETPSTKGTLDLIQHLGADPAAVTSLRYRGDGWPGQRCTAHGR